jgi:hypothetical protein
MRRERRKGEDDVRFDEAVEWVEIGDAGQAKGISIINVGIRNKALYKPDKSV